MKPAYQQWNDFPVNWFKSMGQIHANMGTVIPQNSFSLWNRE